MSLLESCIMGIVQGLTEFLPVSSSGHLAIFKHILGINTETGILFDILLHLGTLIAVFVAYFEDIKKLVIEGCCLIWDCIMNCVLFVKKHTGKEKNTSYRKIVSSSYRKFVMLVIVSTIPTGVMGLIGSDLIEKASETLIIPGIGLLITATLLFIADGVAPGKKTAKDVSYKNGFVLGVCQGVATVPGISRSGTTITACLLSGFDKSFAVKYSFIMSIPAILGATVLELKDIGSLHISGGEWGSYIVGMIVSAIVGFICIKTMLVVVRKKKFKVFSIYCAIAGCIAVICSFVL